MMKTIAIFCVVCAHCGNRVSHSQVDIALEQLRGIVAEIGVPVFFLISGYLFNNQKSFFDFWSAKIKNVIIPWMFWGTIVWAYQVLRKGSGYANLWQWLLGMDTYLWYMRTTVVFWAFFYFVRKSRSKCLMLIVSIICYIVADAGIVKWTGNWFVGSIMTRIVFFAMGVYVREREKAVTQRWLIYMYGVGVSLMLVIVPQFIKGGDANYTVLYVLCGVAVGEWLIRYLKRTCFAMRFAEIGKHSYVIYLIHMPLAGLISNLFSRDEMLLLLVFVQPLIVVMGSELVVCLMQKCFRRWRFVQLLVGTRE